MTAGPKFKLNNKKGGVPRTIEPTVKREQVASGWNNTNIPESKYFDKS